MARSRSGKAAGLNHRLSTSASSPMKIANDEIYYWQREEAAIQAVEPSTMTGQQSSAVLYSSSAFQAGFAQVPELAGNVGQSCQAQAFEQRHRWQQPGKIQGAINDRRRDRGRGSFPGFSGTHARRHLVAANQTSYV